MALANLSAHRNPLFPDQKTFDIAVRHLTENYKSPLKEGVSIVKSILASAIEESAKEFLDTYPRYACNVTTNLATLVKFKFREFSRQKFPVI